MNTPAGSAINAPAPAGQSAIQHGTYSALVQNDTDLVGHVAYAFYKRDKLKFCEQFKTANGRPPDLAELGIFIQGCNLDTRLQSYRAEAETLLETMTEFQLEEAIKQVRIEATDELARKLSESKSWGRSIAEALVGSVVVALLWAAIVLMVYTNKVGADRVAKDIFNVDLNPSQQPAASAPR